MHKLLIIIPIIISFSLMAQPIEASGVVEKQKQQKKSNQPMTAAEKQRVKSLRAIEKKVENEKISYEQRTDTNEITSLAQIWYELEINSEVWPLMIDFEPKESTIEHFIMYWAQRNIYIQNPPSHYVLVIDSMLKDNSALRQSPLYDVLRFAAIIEYDFDNGRDKDQMALQVLGRSKFEHNKKRLGL